jgi:DNA-binding PadR family transcriptional regulator
VWRFPLNQADNLLKRLEKEGMIEPRAVQPSTRRRTVYSLPPGAREVRGGMFAASPCGARTIRIEFITRCSSAATWGKTCPHS